MSTGRPQSAEIRDQYILDIDEALRSVDRVQDELDDLERSIRDAGGASSTIEADFRGVADALGLSEAEARQLADELIDAQQASRRAEAEIRDVAQALDLSERDARDLARQMTRVSQETREADTSAGRFRGTLVAVGGLLAAGVAIQGFQAFTRQATQAIDSASRLEQSIGGVDAIFGDASETVLDFGENAAQSVGLANSAANQLAAQLGGQLQTFGFTAGEAATETANLIELGADLAATFGGPVSQAVEAIGSLLRGEVNPIERYGVSLNQAVIQAEALRLGLAETRSELTLQDRAVASLSLLYEQTANAQGQFAREAGTTAGRLERLRAEAENVRAEFGEALVPAFNNLLDVAPALLEGVEALAPVIADLADTIAGVDFGSLIRDVRIFGNLVADLFGGGLSFDIEVDTEQERRDIRRLGDEVGNTVSAFELFVGLDDLLDAGIEPANALQQVLERLADTTARGDELRDFASELISLSGVEPAGLLDILQTFTTLGDALGFDREQLDILIPLLREAAVEASGIVDIGERGSGRNFLGRTLGDPADIAASSFALVDAADALRILDRAAERNETTIAGLIESYEDLPPRLQAAVDALDEAALRILDFNTAAAGLATSIDVDFGDVVDEFDLLIEKTNEAGDTVPATVEDIVSDLQEQVTRLAELEAATAALEALGLDDLAANLRARGPDAAQAAQDFLADIESAFEAEQLFDQGGQIGDDLLTQLQEALAEGDITPQLLDLVSQFTSAEVQQAVLSAAVETGNLFGSNLTEALEALDLDPIQLERLDLLPEGFEVDIPEIETPDLGGEAAGIAFAAEAASAIKAGLGSEQFVIDGNQFNLSAGFAAEAESTIKAGTEGLAEVFADQIANEDVYTQNIQDALLRAAAEGDSAAVVGELAALGERLTLTIPVEFGPVPNLTVPQPDGVTTTGPTTTFVQENNFFTSPRPDTDTARISQATAAAAATLPESF